MDNGVKPFSFGGWGGGMTTINQAEISHANTNTHTHEHKIHILVQTTHTYILGHSKSIFKHFYSILMSIFHYNKRHL